MFYRSLVASACTLGVLGAAATYKIGMFRSRPDLSGSFHSYITTLKVSKRTVTDDTLT